MLCDVCFEAGLTATPDVVRHMSFGLHSARARLYGCLERIIVCCRAIIDRGDLETRCPSEAVHSNVVRIEPNHEVVFNHCEQHHRCSLPPQAATCICSVLILGSYAYSNLDNRIEGCVPEASSSHGIVWVLMPFIQAKSKSPSLKSFSLISASGSLPSNA